MSFFLLGTHPDGHLSLLSDTAFSTRHDAMAELSKLTASPQFDAWEAEVLVVDSDSGTPVLLVRPTVAQTETDHEPAEAEDLSDPALAAVMLDLGVGGEPSEPQSEPRGEDVEADAQERQRSVLPAENAGQERSAEALVSDTRENPSGEDAFVVESEPPVEVVDAAWAEAVSSSAESDEGLKGALMRTAAKMEADGISAPESVGAVAAASEDGSDAAETRLPEDANEAQTAQVAEPGAAIAETPEADKADEVEEAEPPSADAIPLPEGASEAEPEPLPEIEAAEEAEPAREPESETIVEPEPEVLVEPEAAAEPASESPSESPLESDTSDEPPPGSAAWPWDLAADPDSAPPLAELDEPSADDESMIRALADDDASRTVVLGEYSVDEVSQSEPFVEAAKRAAAEAAIVEAAAEVEDQTSPEQPGEQEAAGEADSGQADPDARDAEESPAPVERAGESDFVDLGEVTPPPAKVYEPGEVDMGGMTCADCVYVDTCPNKDEREPANCGSFQWK